MKGQSQPRVIISTNYNVPESPMLHTKFHENQSTGAREGFLPYMGMVAILVM